MQTCCRRVFACENPRVPRVAPWCCPFAPYRPYCLWSFDFLSFALTRLRLGAFLLGNQIWLFLVLARRPQLACGKMPPVFLFADQFNARAGLLALPLGNRGIPGSALLGLKI